MMLSVKIVLDERNLNISNQYVFYFYKVHKKNKCIHCCFLICVWTIHITFSLSSSNSHIPTQGISNQFKSMWGINRQSHYNYEKIVTCPNQFEQCSILSFFFSFFNFITRVQYAVVSFDQFSCMKSEHHTSKYTIYRNKFYNHLFWKSVKIIFVFTVKLG